MHRAEPPVAGSLEHLQQVFSDRYDLERSLGARGWMRCRALEAIIARSLAVFPEERYANAAELAAALRAIEPLARRAGQPAIAVLPFASPLGKSADTQLGEGLAEEIINLLARVRALRVASRTATMRAVALCRVGRPDDGLDWARRAPAIDPEDAGVRHNVACLYALEGRSDEALDCLGACVQLGFGNVEWVGRDPDMQSLHGHPRFAALLGATW